MRRPPRRNDESRAGIKPQVAGAIGEVTGSDTYYFVVVTFERPSAFRVTLASALAQVPPPARVVVVDNSPTVTNWEAVRPSSDVPIDYLPQATNVGFAGGLAAAIEHVVAIAEPDDWVMICPDDIPLDTTDFAVKTVRVANAVLALDPYTGAVGRLGSEIDVSVGRMHKWHRSHRANAWEPRIQPVDFVATGPAPVFRVRCFMEAGGFRRELFIGMTEVEMCMRLRRAGFSLYVLPDLPFVRATREAWTEGPARMGSPWREYYSVRNFLTVMREHSTRRSAAYFALRHGILRPVARFLMRPSRSGGRRVLMSWRGVRDAYRGRLGQRVGPEAETARPRT